MQKTMRNKYIAHLFKISCTHILVEIYTMPAPFLHCWRLPNHSLLPALRGHYNPRIYLLRNSFLKTFVYGSSSKYVAQTI